MRKFRTVSRGTLTARPRTCPPETAPTMAPPGRVLPRLHAIGVGPDAVALAVNHDRIEIENQVIIRGDPNDELDVRSPRDCQTAILAAHILVHYTRVNPVVAPVDIDPFVRADRDRRPGSILVKFRLSRSRSRSRSRSWAEAIGTHKHTISAAPPMSRLALKLLPFHMVKSLFGNWMLHDWCQRLCRCGKARLTGSEIYCTG